MGAAAKALLSALALTIALAVPASAGAAGPVGSASFVVSAGKWRTLDQRGIALGGAGAAESEGRRTRLQISGGTIGDGVARLTFAGSLKLVAGEGRQGGTVRLSGLRADLGPDSNFSAKLGKKRRVLFDLEGGTLTTSAAKGSAQLQGARLVWRRGAAEAIGNRLGTDLPRGSFGLLDLSAATLLTEGPPKSGPIGNEPPLLARPAGAVDVTTATLAWHVRDSWIRYVNTQEAPQPLEGAVPEPPIQESKHPCPNSPAGANPTLVYSYDFPFASGWYDPASGTASLYYRGGVRFSYPAHGIDVTARNPEIEINGATSRSIFRLRGAAETPYPDQRAALLSLPSSTPIQGPPGGFSFPGPLRGTLTADGQTVFAGFYPPPNDGFGCFSISFSTG
ncbi:MAG TPA: HtaA domain-containing protein [Solirubrobacterales bacterium]|jgi:hypothetical protein|nr:HtaA domain-containing protein [Solirubrobacterales bacterium]